MYMGDERACLRFTFDRVRSLFCVAIAISFRSLQEQNSRSSAHTVHRVRWSAALGTSMRASLSAMGWPLFSGLRAHAYASTGTR